jgi:CII-binding regulator of phage lambda lysogenization HflD
MLLVTLTEKPEKEHLNMTKYVYVLQEYKQAFIGAKEVLKTLAQHIADCITRDSESRNEKHDQMLELIIYLIRNILAIPDRKRKGVRGTNGIGVYDSKEDQMKDLHFRFLHKLCDESILDALIYMCQDFTP